jgi:hypothetical protein
MSTWQLHSMGTKVIDVLNQIHLNTGSHPFGRPFVSSYQIALGLQNSYPQTVAAIGKPIGGRGVGRHDSLAQYVGGELARQIRQQGSAHPIEGAFVSNDYVAEIRYVDAAGNQVISSLTGTPYDLALFRLR